MLLGFVVVALICVFSGAPVPGVNLLRVAGVEPLGRSLRCRHRLHHALQRSGAWGGVAAVVLLVGAADEFVDLGPVWPLGVPAAVDCRPTLGGLAVGGGGGDPAAASALVLEIHNQGGVVGGFSDVEICVRLALIAVHLDLRDSAVQALGEQGVINPEPVILGEP